MQTPLLSLIYPLTRVLLAVRVATLLIAPALVAHAQAGADSAWQQFPDSPIARQSITALIVADSGDVWAGTDERGLARWDGRAWSIITAADGLADGRIVALHEDRRGRLWVATGMGLGYLRGEGGAWRAIGSEGLPALPVTAFAEDAGGRVWLGTPRGLTSWGEDGALEVAPELAGQRVLALTAVGESVWAATDGGLWREGANGWQQVDGPPSAAVQLAADSAGRLYALAAGRIWRLEQGAWQAVELPFGQVVTAFAFRGDELWLASAGNVHAARDGITQSFDAALLPGGTVTKIAVAEDGALWFASTAGLASHRPGASLPAIRSVTINGAQVLGEGLTLARNRLGAVMVDVADASEGRAAAAPGQITLLAQLEGVDAAPRIVRGNLLDAYKDMALAPGEYSLRVTAVDEAFNRSAEKRIAFRVRDLTYLPLGLAVPTELVAPVEAAFVLLLAAIATIALTRSLERRDAAREAAREAARVRAILAQAGNPYEDERSLEPALRAEQAREIVSALAGEGRSVLLLGPHGMGKTTLLRHLATDAQRHGTTLFLAYLDLSAISEREFFAQAAAALSSAVAPRIIGERPRLDALRRAADTSDGGGYGEREFSADVARLFAALHPSPSSPITAALLLDNAEALDSYRGPTRDAIRRLIVAGGGRGASLRLVLAAEDAPVALQGLASLLRTVHLRPLPAPALQHLLLRPAEGVYEWDGQAAAETLALSGGEPGRLREIASAAVAAAQREGRISIARADIALPRPTS